MMSANLGGNLKAERALSTMSAHEERCGVTYQVTS